MQKAERGNFRAGGILALVAAMLLAFAGCGARPALAIAGDCEGYLLAANASLEEAIALARPRAEEFDVLLMGGDGLVAQISGGELDGCALAYSRENAWELKSELHPPSARVKNLALVAVTRAPEGARAFLRSLKEEGTSAKNGRSVTVYTARMITETSSDALRFLAQGQRVMVIELDGLGWEMLQQADAPFLESLRPGEALAAFPPISPVGLASMLTGVTPDAHGVHDRENRRMAREDMFAKAKGMGKTRAYIEGSHALLNTSLAPVLSLNDAEALANAQQALEGNPDLLFVHFHGIDETAHEYGPYAEQTIQKIREIDGYARALTENFDGRVIITADHGLHEAGDGGGDHGQFLPEDMIVPYIIK
jgi:hypothetical protein